MSQKFMRGDLVHVCKEMPDCMSHFQSDFDAVVLGSYADLYDGENDKQYSLLRVSDGNRISWYYEEQLTLLKHNQEHIIYEWRERDRRAKLTPQTEDKA